MLIEHAIKMPVPRGLIDIEVGGPSGIRTAHVENAITKQLMDLIFNYIGDDRIPGVPTALNSYRYDCVIGNGITDYDYNSTAVSGDNTVSKLVPATIAPVTRETIDGRLQAVMTLSVTFNPGQFVGSLSEIAILGASNATPSSLRGLLLAGTVLKSPGGSVTPITVEAEDYVKLEYRLVFDVLGNNSLVLGNYKYTSEGVESDFAVTCEGLWQVPPAQSPTGQFFMRSPAQTVPSPTATSMQSRVMRINGGSTFNASNFVRVDAYDAAVRERSFDFSWMVPPTQSQGAISTIEFVGVPANTTNTWHALLVKFAFQPDLPRPVENKIVCRYKLTFTW